MQTPRTKYSIRKLSKLSRLKHIHMHPRMKRFRLACYKSILALSVSASMMVTYIGFYVFNVDANPNEDYSIEGYSIEENNVRLIINDIETFEFENETEYNEFIDEMNEGRGHSNDTYTVLNSMMGNDIIEVDGYTFNRYELPSAYYNNIDFSSFQPYMDYIKITNIRSQAYKISHSTNAYTDEYGLRRYKTNVTEQFTLEGQDDYIIALGTYYKTKGICGERFLIVTTTGMYTAITGDEKSDAHTDKMNMFTTHKNGTCAGLIEWIVETNKLERTVQSSGNVAKTENVTPLQGEILYIYKIS